MTPWSPPHGIAIDHSLLAEQESHANGLLSIIDCPLYGAAAERPSQCLMHNNLFHCKRMTPSFAQAAHPVLYQSKDLQNFLEASEDVWAQEMARAKHESANPAQKTLNTTLAKLKLFGQQTVAGGKTADDDEDPEYLKVRVKGSCMHHATPNRVCSQQPLSGACESTRLIWCGLYSA